jgi:hypothetical protein
MAIILRFSFSFPSFLFILTLLGCDLNLLHIHRENSQESTVSDFGAMGNFIRIANLRSFSTIKGATGADSWWSLMIGSRVRGTGE